jgi:hypothetical protein
MEPQHPPVPFSATRNGQQPHQPSHDSAYEHTYNEKEDYSQQQPARAERGSKTSSNGRCRDSVISHPFSPKQSYPPSPCSSISSAGKGRHASIQEIQSPTLDNSPQNLRRPPQAHLDPEKHGYGSQDRHSHRHSGSARAANDAVYDQGQYHEKAPEEKAWQLLVSPL